MYWIAPIASFFIAAALSIYLPKRFPWIKPHHVFVIESAVIVVFNLITLLIFTPAINGLYADLGKAPTYILSPNIYWVLTSTLLGLIALSLLVSRGLQRNFNRIFANKVMLLVLELLLVGLIFVGFAINTYLPLYQIAN